MVDSELVARAMQARLNAHAPYSEFLVGAAVLTEDGSIFCGANVENASYSLTNCAERVALQSAIAAGIRGFVRIAVVADTAEPVSPCGACRQVMVELAPDAEVLLANLGGKLRKTRVSKLLPDSFTSAQLTTRRMPTVSMAPSANGEARLPLEGTRVLDLTRILAGPFATQKLADMGAEVIKIERPGSGDDTRAWGPPFASGHSTYFLSINRGKRSVELDLKHPTGKEALRRLIRKADVLIENFRPGVLEKLGFGWKQLQKLNPRLVYCSISGFGHNSKRRAEPSFDVLIQAESGLMSLNGDADGPPWKVGVSIADEMAGQLAVEGILLAMHARHRTGRGDHVDIALLDGIFALLSYQGQLALSSDRDPWRMGNRHPSIVPYETFPTSDRDLVVGVGNEAIWQRFCQALGQEALQTDPRFASNRQRVENRELLGELLAEVFKTRGCDTWVAILQKARVPVAAIRDVRQAFAAAERDSRGQLVEVDHPEIGKLRMVGNPIQLASLRGHRPRYAPPPLLGEHTREVLRELGFPETTLDELGAARPSP